MKADEATDKGAMAVEFPGKVVPFREQLMSVAGVAAVSLAILGLACVAAALVETPESGSSLLRLLGDLHPLLVHFPIALILVGFLLDIFGLPWARRGFLIAAGTLSASAAAATGLFLSRTGGYDATLLFRHKIMGISLVVAGSVLLLARAPLEMPRARRPLLWLTTVLVLFTGHLGGSLTHGSGYLTRNLPAPVRAWIGETRSQQGRLDGLEDPAAALLFADLVQPILDQHCSECHGTEKKRGGLQVGSLAALLRGGEEGPALVPGHPESSPLYRRMILPPDDRDHMPPAERDPVPIAETELVRWWVELGAREDLRLGNVGAEETPSAVRAFLTRLGIPPDFRRRRFSAIPPPDHEVVESLKVEGLPVNYLSQEKNLLQVDFSLWPQTVSAADLERLLPVAQQVLWMNLGNQNLPDEAFTLLAQFTNLEKLHLENSSVEDRHLPLLGSLQALEYLNVYGTRVGNSGLEELGNLPRLRHLYVWRTQVTQQGATRLQSRLPELQIHGPFPEIG